MAVRGFCSCVFKLGRPIHAQVTKNLMESLPPYWNHTDQTTELGVTTQLGSGRKALERAVKEGA
jgi:hypothetical protein